MILILKITKSELARVQVRNADFLLLKKRVKFKKMIKNYFIQSTLHRLLYISPIFREICENHVSKNLPLLGRTIHRAIFLLLRTKLLWYTIRCLKFTFHTCTPRKDSSNCVVEEKVEYIFIY